MKADWDYSTLLGTVSDPTGYLDSKVVEHVSTDARNWQWLTSELGSDPQVTFDEGDIIASFEYAVSTKPTSGNYTLYVRCSSRDAGPPVLYDNRYGFQVDTGYVAIFKYVGGVYSLLASSGYGGAGFNTGLKHTAEFKVEGSGASITVTGYVDGSQEITFTDTDNDGQATGFVGYDLAGTFNETFYVDNYETTRPE